MASKVVPTPHLPSNMISYNGLLRSFRMSLSFSGFSSESRHSCAFGTGKYASAGAHNTTEHVHATTTHPHGTETSAASQLLHTLTILASTRATARGARVRDAGATNPALCALATEQSVIATHGASSMQGNIKSALPCTSPPTSIIPAPGCQGMARMLHTAASACAYILHHAAPITPPSCPTCAPCLGPCLAQRCTPARHLPPVTCLHNHATAPAPQPCMHPNTQPSGHAQLTHNRSHAIRTSTRIHNGCHHIYTKPPSPLPPDYSAPHRCTPAGPCQNPA